MSYDLGQFELNFGAMSIVEDPPVSPDGWEVTFYDSKEAWWLDQQAGEPLFSIGGTTFANILGVGFGSPWSVWEHAKTPLGPYIPAPEDTVLSRGLRWEPWLGQDYAKKTGYEVKQPLCRVSRPDLPWVRTSPDGFVFKDGKLVGLVEFKTSLGWAGWGQDGQVVREVVFDAEDPPCRLGYLAQCQLNMHVVGAPWCDLYVGVMDDVVWLPETRLIRIYYDANWCRVAVDAVAGWREKHLIGGRPPEVDGSDECNHHIAELSADYEAAEGEASEGLVGEAEAYQALRAEIDELEARRAYLRNSILDQLGEFRRRRLVLEDGTSKCVYRSRNGSKPSLSATRIREAAPDIWARLEERNLVSYSPPSEYPGIRTSKKSGRRKR